MLYLLSKAIKDMEIMKKAKKRGSSVPLTKVELASLKKFRTGFVTEVQCALEIGIDRNVLSRVLALGSGSPDTIEKIRIAIGMGEINAGTIGG